MSEASIADGDVGSYGLEKRIEPVRKCRGLGKADMKLNDTLPQIAVNPKMYRVTADGEELVCQPAKRLPLAQRFSIF